MKQDSMTSIFVSPSAISIACMNIGHFPKLQGLVYEFESSLTLKNFAIVNHVESGRNIKFVDVCIDATLKRFFFCFLENSRLDTLVFLLRLYDKQRFHYFRESLYK